MKHFFIRSFLIVTLFFSILIAWLISDMFFPGFSLTAMIEDTMDNQPLSLVLFVIEVIAIFGIIGLSVLAIMKRNKWLTKNENNLATGSFANDQEMQSFSGKDGLLIGKKFRLSEKKSFEHMVLVGPTGSGKSASFFIPNLLALPKHASVIVSDPKGELFEKTAAQAIANGKKVLVFAPFKKNSMKYNPLALCESVTEIRELAQILLANGNAAVESMTGTKAGGAEWTNMATPLLTAFLIYVQSLRPPKNTISYALSLIIENDIDTMRFLIDGDAQAQKQFNIFMQSAESEKTASSIKTVLASNLQMFMDPLIEEVTSLNEINPLQLREHPTHFHIIVPEFKSSFMSPIMAPFYTQIMNRLVENGKGCPVYFLLDEFANIGLIPNIDVLAATIRSRNMSLALGIQSVNQLKQRYGEASQSLLDNLKCKCALPGLSFDSAKFFSDMVGFKEVQTTSTSFGKESTSHSVSVQKRELLTPDEIRRLEDETLIAIIDNKNPLLDTQIRYYKEPWMLKATQKEMDLEAYIADMRSNKKSESS